MNVERESHSDGFCSHFIQYYMVVYVNLLSVGEKAMVVVLDVWHL